MLSKWRDADNKIETTIIICHRLLITTPLVFVVVSVIVFVVVFVVVVLIVVVFVVIVFVVIN